MHLQSCTLTSISWKRVERTSSDGIFRFVSSYANETHKRNNPLRTSRNRNIGNGYLVILAEFLSAEGVSKFAHAASRFRTENSVIVSLCNTSHTLQCTKRRRRIPSLLETCTLCIATVFPRRAKGWCSFYPSREIEKKKWKITITRNRHALESRTR